MATVSSPAASVRTTRTWLAVVAWVTLVVGVAAIAHTPLSRAVHPPSLLGGIVAYMLALVCFAVWGRKWLERRGHVSADEEGLRLDGRSVVTRKAIKHADLYCSDGAARLSLRCAFRTVDVLVNDEEKGNALLRALRLDAANSVGEYRMRSGTYRAAWLRASTFASVALSATALAMSFSVNVVILIYVLLGMALIGAISLSHEFVGVTVGVDGIRIRRALRRGRFIPFRDVASISNDRRDVVMLLRDGTRIAMHHPLGNHRARDGRLLVARVTAQCAAHKNPVRSGPVALSSRDRSTQEWLREVRIASDDFASFRSGAIPGEALWRIVEDPSAAPSDRVGAALALRNGLDEAGRTRIASLANACAGPRVRAALLATVSVSDDPSEHEDLFSDVDADGRRHSGQ